MTQLTRAMRARNKLGALTHKKGVTAEELAAARLELAVLALESKIQIALDAGVTPGKIAYLAKKLAGAQK